MSLFVNPALDVWVYNQRTQGGCRLVRQRFGDLISRVQRQHRRRLLIRGKSRRGTANSDTPREIEPKPYVEDMDDGERIRPGSE